MRSFVSMQLDDNWYYPFDMMYDVIFAYDMTFSTQTQLSGSGMSGPRAHNSRSASRRVCQRARCALRPPSDVSVSFSKMEKLATHGIRPKMQGLHTRIARFISVKHQFHVNSCGKFDSKRLLCLPVTSGGCRAIARLTHFTPIIEIVIIRLCNANMEREHDPGPTWNSSESTQISSSHFLLLEQTIC